MHSFCKKTLLFNVWKSAFSTWTYYSSILAFFVGARPHPVRVASGQCVISSQYKGQTGSPGTEAAGKPTADDQTGKESRQTRKETQDTHRRLSSSTLHVQYTFTSAVFSCMHVLQTILCQSVRVIRRVCVQMKYYWAHLPTFYFCSHSFILLSFFSHLSLPLPPLPGSPSSLPPLPPLSLTLPLQARASSLGQQLAEVHEQAEQGHVERQTFKRLHDMEAVAIPRRLEVELILHTYIKVNGHLGHDVEHLLSYPRALRCVFATLIHRRSGP